jgi:hypothetical protein
MRVHMLKEQSVILDKINSKNYPAGWQGEVDDTTARGWIKAGAAEEIGADTSKPVEFTNEERAVLKGAAQQALAQAIARQASSETIDPATGEVTVTPVDDGGEAEQTPAEVLASMTFAEVKALAKQYGVKIVGVKRPAIEKAILDKLAAEQGAEPA